MPGPQIRGDSRLELQVINALSGVLRCKIVANPLWPVHRVKTEIANVEGTPALDQHMIIGNRQLQDHEIIGAVLADGHDPCPSVMLVRAGTLCEDPTPRDLTLFTCRGTICVHWTVDARKLQKNDRLMVSQPFSLDLWGGSRRVDFKMLIYPHCAASFRKAAGRGRIELKCSHGLPEDVTDMSFCVSVGDGKKFEALRGPFSHDFAVNGVGRLPKGQEEFDLKAAVDPESVTFVVRLEVSRKGGSGASAL
mmetsp:Transcript_2908/g.8101  ORF Transcript_2908/g.8101 Transcript_2908/m.8101 type:complete len:250 (-) Transcript_2908:261-1010(-)